MPFTLEELLPKNQQLHSVRILDAVTHVLDVMHQHGFSQLPVVEADGKTSRGQVVTFAGILQAVQSFKVQPEMLQVKDVARRVRTYAPDADLLATLDSIQRDNFALIVDDGVLTGIVTTADTTDFFRDYAQDLMQIEGIELRMKEAITALFAGDDSSLETAIARVTDRAADIRRKLPAAIRGYLEKSDLKSPAAGTDKDALAEAEKRLSLPKPGKAFDQLTFDELTKVLLDHPKAPKLSKANDVSELRKLLEAVRDARNKLAHFRGELSGEERRHIELAAEWLEQNLPLPEPPPITIPPPTSVPKPEPVTAPPVEVKARPPEDRGDAPHGTYAALSIHLGGVPKSTNSLVLTFQEIEGVLGKELPQSAFDYRAWWANDPSKPQSAAWLDEGWRVSSIAMADRRVTFVRSSDRAEAYIKFFEQLSCRLRKISGFPIAEIQPKGASWQVLASLNWMGHAQAASIFATFTRKKELRIELYLDVGDKTKNEQRFEELFSRKSEIEAIIGEPLSWERRDDARACRIAVYTPAQIEKDKQNPALLEWATQKAVAFYRAFGPEFPM